VLLRPEVADRGPAQPAGGPARGSRAPPPARPGGELPKGWVVATSKSTGKQYYYNIATKESRYERPGGTRRPAPAPGQACLLGLGRTVVTETEALILLANLVQSG
jgi:hypothetical protein